MNYEKREHKNPFTARPWARDDQERGCDRTVFAVSIGTVKFLFVGPRAK